MIMDIVIIAHFCLDFSDKDNGRFNYLANILSKDNNVELITTDFYHITKTKRETIPQLSYKVTVLQEPGYPRNVCLRRFYSHYIWGKNLKKYLLKRKKPDIIFSAIPSLTGPYEAAKYCRKNNIPFIIDIQDLWPEAFQMVFNIPIVSQMVFSPFRFLANNIYKSANKICAVSDTYAKRALEVNSSCNKAEVVFLGTDLNVFDNYVKTSPKVRKGKSEIWIGYCGTLGSSYDIKIVIDALNIIDNNDLRFIVMGNGPKQKEFENYAKEKNVNVEFTGRLSYDVMCGILAHCDIVVNPIVHGAAQSIINKHADYAAAGKPIINTQENDEYRSLIELYKMGYNCKNNDAKDIADKIILLLNNDELKKYMGKNARKCAEELFNRKYTYKKILNLLQSYRIE